MSTWVFDPNPYPQLCFRFSFVIFSACLNFFIPVFRCLLSTKFFLATLEWGVNYVLPISPSPSVTPSKSRGGRRGEDTPAKRTPRRQETCQCHKYHVMLFHFLSLLTSIRDPDSLNPDRFWAFGCWTQFFVTKMWKKFCVRQKGIYFSSLAAVRDVKAPDPTARRISLNSIKNSSIFFFGTILAFLDPDLDSEFGSESNDLIESWSATRFLVVK